MEGSGSGSNWKGGLPTIPPRSNDGAEGDVPHDPATRRRLANRQYSETYRRKKQESVLNLQVQEKYYLEIISNSSPRVEYHVEVQQPYFVAEGNSLMGTISGVSSSLEAGQAEKERLTSELEAEQMKLNDAVQKAIRKSKGR